jgi:hypothetical protein
MKLSQLLLNGYSNNYLLARKLSDKLESAAHKAVI